MAALKSKKTLVILSISILLLCVLVGMVIWFSGLSSKIEQKEPIDTEELFPKPDEIVADYNGQQFVLTGEYVEEIYRIFLESIGDREGFEKIEDCEHIQKQTFYKVEWEFRYKKPYRYIGNDDAQLVDEQFSFSKISMQSVYHNDASIRCSHFLSENSENGTHIKITTKDFATKMENVVIASIMQTSAWKATNSEPHISNIFPAKPDSILIYQDGKSLEINGEELDHIYQIFADQAANDLIMLAQNGIHSGFFIQTVQGSTCVEFRYHQRQKFVSNSQKEDPIIGVWLSDYYNNTEYDKLLFTIGKDAFGDNSFYCVTCLDGYCQYYYAAIGIWGWDSTSEELMDLTAYIKELLQA